jgi:hypothetical protein
MSTFPFRVGQILTSNALNALFDVPVANVMGFGDASIAGGVTDAGGAIRAAVASLNGVPGVVLMPQGTYRVTGAMIVLPSGTRLSGAGSNVTIIKPDTLVNADGTRTIFANQNRLTLGLGTSVSTTPANQTDTNIQIDNIGFDLSNCATVDTAASLGSFLLASNITIKNIRADNFTASSAKGFSGFQFVGVDAPLVDNFYARHCVNALDNWKGTTRAKFTNLNLESADAAGNGGVINWNAIGTTQADFEDSVDLQISNATIWLNNGSIALYLDAGGPGSESANVLLDNIAISARAGSSSNTGIVFRGWTSQLKARGVNFNAVSGADMRPINIGGFFSPTASVTSTSLVTTANGSVNMTVSYPGGARIGPGNYMQISNGSGGAVTGNGVSLNGYYLITAVSGPVTSTSSGDTFTVTAPNVATGDGALSGTTKLLGYWGCAASCDFSGITIDGCSASGGDLITLGGSGHQAVNVEVTTNYNGSTTPQYRSIVAVDSTQAHELTTKVACNVLGIVGAPGTVSLQAGWSGDNTLTWITGGVQPIYWYSGTSSVDHVLSTTDATIGTSLANNILLQGRATGFPPRVIAQGTDTDINLGLHFKGNGNVQVQDNGGATRHTFSTSAAALSLSSGGVAAFATTGVASQVNFVTAVGAVTGAAPRLTTASSGDANTPLLLVANGTSGILAKAYAPAATPTTTDIPAGTWAVWKDTSGGTVKLYYNDGGSLKSVTLS